LQYQVHKELESIAQRQLQREFESDPGMNYEEYYFKHQQITSYSKGFPRNEIVRIDNLILNNRGHLKLNIKGHKANNAYDYGAFRTRSDDPLKLRGNLHLNGSFKIGLEIEDFDLWSQFDKNQEWEIQARWVLKW